MKSVAGMIVVFIGLYLIAASDVLSFFAHKSLLYIAIGLCVIAILAAAAILGTPFSKPLIKRRGDDNDEDSHRS